MAERSKEEMAIIEKYSRALSQVFLGYKEVRDCEELLDNLGTRYNKIDVSKMLGYCDTAEVTRMALVPIFYTAWKDLGLMIEQLTDLYQKACENLKKMSPKEMDQALYEAGIVVEEEEAE